MRDDPEGGSQKLEEDWIQFNNLIRTPIAPMLNQLLASLALDQMLNF